MKNYFDYFLKPESVAIIGASTRTGPESFNIIEVMKAKGCRGEIYPVNPKAGEILGIKAYPSILDIPGEVDLAVIATGRVAVPELVRQCVKKPVKAIIIVTQGFADADPEGKKMQDQIMDMVSGTGIRVMGPNTLGVINNFDNFTSAFVNVPTKSSPVGVICQSGMFLNGQVDIFGGFGYGVDIGNAADIGFNEVLEFFGREDRIEVINLHMEGIRGGREFVALGREITRKKPVIVYKTGRSEEGARAAGSHSGSLAGEDHVYQAAFKKAGIIRAESFDELRDFNKAFAKYKNAPGNRVAVITFTGGGGIALLDAMERNGLVPAKLSPETVDKISRVFPDWLEVSNPLDVWPSVMMYGFGQVYPPVLEYVLNDPGVDMMVCITASHHTAGGGFPYGEDFFLEAARKRPDKPVALWIFGSARQKMTELLESSGPVAVFASPERLARALGELYRYYRHIRKEGLSAAGRPGKYAAALSGAGGGKGAVLGGEAMDMLNSAGIPAVRGRLARNLEEALEAARDIGYPLAMKVVSPQLVHKTEAGGVRLGIRDEEDLKQSYRSMMDEVGRRAPGARVEGVLIQECLSGGVELILGAKRDREFGPVLVFGLGGIYTEIIKDVAFRIAPVTGSEALEMVRETGAFQLLKGARGKEPADMDALVRAVVALSDLVSGHPEISEVDINPLLATPQGVVALDGRIIISLS
ncbi:MAG: acetate--CoA ligase family protein [Bacillota bacterium]